MQSFYVRFRRQRGLLLLGTALALALLLNGYHRNIVRRDLQRVLHTHQVLRAGEQFLSALKDCQTEQRGYLLTGKEAHLVPFEAGKVRVRQILVSLRDQTLDSPTQQQRLERLASLTTQQLKELELSVALRRSSDADSALMMVTPDPGKAAMDSLRILLQALMDDEQELLRYREEQFAQAQLVHQFLQAGLLALVMASLAWLLWLLHQEHTVRKGLLAQVEAQNRTLLMNTTPVGASVEDVDTLDEEAVVARLAANLRSATDFVFRIGQGQYEADLPGVTPENLPANVHTLSGVLLRMRQQLIRGAEEDKRRIWATEGLARFAELQRTHAKDNGSVADQILRFLIRYLGANQGALFGVEKQEAESDLTTRNTGETLAIRMIACYAYDRKKYLQKTLAEGEGLVGQCVREADTIYLTQVPREYVQITSGLGEATPTALLIVPLKLDGNVYGVVELASFKPFEPYQIAFLEKLAESMASAMATLQMQRQTHKLLEESQQQAGMLRAQEEEMRQSLEELHATQEEMRRKNEAMEGLLEEAQQKELVMQEQEKMMRQSMEEAAKLQRELYVKDQQQRKEIEQLKAAHQAKEKELEELLQEMKINEQDLQQNEDRFRRVLLQLQQQEAELKEKTEFIQQLQQSAKE